MSRVLLVCSLSAVLTATSLSASSPAVFARYRDVMLGDSFTTVVERLQVESSTVRVLSQDPSLVQEVTWRPHRFLSGMTVVPDPLAEMVLTFHFDRLVRVVAIYDRDRIEGLTDPDLVELLSAVYGLPLLPSTSKAPRGAAALRQTLAVWMDADTQLLLWRDEYPRRVGLTVATIAAEPALQAAVVEGARRSAEGDPQREREARAAAAKTLMERVERIRLANKAGFKP
jgi:hypothetical protein